MITTLDIIDVLPGELQARLEADDYFSDIPVIVAEEGNAKQQMARRLAMLTEKGGKRGAAVIVLPMLAEDLCPNLQFGPMTLRPAFQVLENLELNRGKNGTGKSARRIARRIVLVIKTCGLVGLIADLKADKPAIEPIDVSAELGDQVKGQQVNFVCLETSPEKHGQVAMPLFASYPAETPKFQITCATAGAQIYFTQDDSYPSHNNNQATLYAAPLDIPDGGVTVRACAYKEGMIASWVNRGTITAS